MRSFVSIFCLLGLYSALGAGFASSAVAQQSGYRGANQRLEVGAKHQAWLQRTEQKNIEGNDAQPASGPDSGLKQASGRERLSLEERRKLRLDINNAGRDLYRQDSPRRPNPF